MRLKYKIFCQQKFHLIHFQPFLMSYFYLFILMLGNGGLSGVYIRFTQRGSQGPRRSFILLPLNKFKLNLTNIDRK